LYAFCSNASPWKVGRAV